MPNAISAAEFSGLMQGLGPLPGSHFAVAVSGGADSTALLLLAAGWAKAHGHTLAALTVDHGLRAEAAAEARQVASWCEKLSIPHQTLTWQPPTRTTALQEQARLARYGLMKDWCKKHGFTALLTAHHLGDQAETLFFRLARGSGLDGLAGIHPVSELSGITLLRPLLCVPKTRLIATLKAAAQEWLEDPSNQKPHYTRNRIRHMLAATGQQEALEQRAFVVSQKLLAFREALERGQEESIQSCVTAGAYPGTLMLDYATFAKLQPGYGLRVLAEALKDVGGAAYKARTHKLERLYSELRQGFPSTRRTLGGCILEPKKRHKAIFIYPEN